MNQENNKDRQKELGNYLGMLGVIKKSMDDYLYLMECGNGRIHFFGKIEEEFSLAMEDGSCTLQDWMKIIYPKDLAAAAEAMEEIRQGKCETQDMEYRILDRRRNRVWISSKGSLYRDAEGSPLMVLGRISTKALGEKVDPLTGLLNGHKYMEDIRNSVACGQSGCLMLLDLDNFKEINIKYGRVYGNRMIRQVAEALEEIVDSAYLPYRLDGDCFAVNMVSGGVREAKLIFGELQKKVREVCTLSAGVVPYSGTETDGETLYQYAESALDRAKRQGRNRLTLFSDDDYREQQSIIELQDEMEQSVKNGFEGFFICYQPQVDCRTCRICGVEALLRYRSPSRGLVGPAEFIPLLEQSGLICRVGEWVLQKALVTCRQWRKTIPELRVSVNISYIQLQQEDIAEQVLDAVRASGLPGNALTLELTESMQLRDYQYFNLIFYRWESQGISIAIDDFGTGYSNLSYLKSIKVDEIKIDRSFVRGIQHSTYNYRLLSNAIELAKSTQIRVCCEGVETEDELLALRELLPNTVQGYLFAVPCREAEFEASYISRDTEAYRKRLEKETRYQLLENREGQPASAPDHEEELSSIVENIDDVVFVSDAESCELYYMNSAGRRITGIYDYKGRKCYEVLLGRSRPCEGCEVRALSRDHFRPREILNPHLKRRILIREKLITWKQRPARLEVAVDITERENVSQAVQQKLDFEQHISKGVRILAEKADSEQAVKQALYVIGDYYWSDRVSIMQPLEDRNFWCKSFERCRPGVLPQRPMQKKMPARLFRRLLDAFRKKQSVNTQDMDAIQELYPEEWEFATRQGIYRLLAAPILKGGQLVGFLSIDNAQRHLADLSFLNTMACLLAERLDRDGSVDQRRRLLNSSRDSILGKIKLGLWVIRIHEKQEESELFADSTMLHLLDLPVTATAQECYRHWYSRINEGYYHYVNSGVEKMLNTDHTVQVEYTWNHPRLGEVVVRCVGRRTEDSAGMICLEGYHRVISNIERPRSFEHLSKRVIFEYNERRRSAFFHNGRELLGMKEERIEDFPESWIRTQVVHPDFAEEFRKVFQNVEYAADLGGIELLLRGERGMYEWFKVRTRHLSSERQDRHTIIVLLDPAGQDRIMELELMRKSDFYEAMLSETIAYAEVDVDNGQVHMAGGLWADYEDECRQWNETFFQVINRYLIQNVAKEDVERCRSYFQEECLRSQYRSQKSIQKYSFRYRIEGELRWVELATHVFLERFSRRMYALIYLKDIDVQKKHELEQESAANTDPLTRVYNRRMFERQVEYFMQQEKGSPSGALLIFDIDDFKAINDRYGHGEGDAALLQMTEILQNTFRCRDIIGRLGGDEFVAFIKDVTRHEILDRRLTEFFQALRRKDGVAFTCSVGITLVKDGEFCYEKALREADQALYRSKQLGKKQICYYEELQAEHPEAAE